MRNDAMLASKSWFQEDFWFLNVLLLFKIKCLNYWPLECHFSDRVFGTKGRSQFCIEEEMRLGAGPVPWGGRCRRMGGSRGRVGAGPWKLWDPLDMLVGEAVAIDRTPPLRCWPEYSSSLPLKSSTDGETWWSQRSVPITLTESCTHLKGKNARTLEQLCSGHIPCVHHTSRKDSFPLQVPRVESVRFGI